MKLSVVNKSQGAYTIKLFTAVFSGVFAYAIHFHPSLIFARKAEAYQRLHSNGRLLSLPENIGIVNGISKHSSLLRYGNKNCH